MNQPAPISYRILAALTDCLLQVAWIMFILYRLSDSSDVPKLMNNLLIGISIILIVPTALQVLQTYLTYKFGGSIGKLLFGLQVVGVDEKKLNLYLSFLRTFLGPLISSLACGLGYLWIFYDKNRRGWHDLAFQTQVIKLKNNRHTTGTLVFFVTLLSQIFIFVVILQNFASNRELYQTIFNELRDEFKARQQQILDQKKSAEKAKNLETIGPLAPLNMSISQAHNNLGLSLLKKLATKNLKSQDENIFFSPTSIALAVSVAFHGARGKTQEEMARVLGYENLSLLTIAKDNQSLKQNLLSSTSGNVLIADSLWINTNPSRPAAIDEQYSKEIQKYYSSSIRELDFTNPLASNEINNWVSAQTKSKITKIVPDELDPLVLLMILNTIHFKANWSKWIMFDKSDTKVDTFTSDSGKKSNISLMYQESNLNYYEDAQLQAVQLPYGNEGKDNRFSMIVLLPKKNDLNSLINEFNLEKFTKIQRQFSADYKFVELTLPKFTLSYEKELMDTFESLGMTEAFTKDANFKGMLTPDSNPVKIGSIIHKSILEVDEEGTEAAAVTKIEIPVTGGGYVDPKDIVVMKVNRPFVVMIEDSTTQEILFIGAIRSL